MLANYLFENIPNLSALTFDQPLGGLDRGSLAT
jgi:hypothetical protein